MVSAKCGLIGDRNRKVNPDSDLARLEVSYKSVTTLGRDKYRKQMPVRWGVRKKPDLGVVDRIQIACRDLPAAICPRFQARQSYPTEQRGLQFVKAAVVADTVVAVPGRLAVVAQSAGLCVETGIVGEDGSAVAHRSEILCGVETCRGYIASVAGGRSDRLGAVFDHLH